MQRSFLLFLTRKHLSRSGDITTVLTTSAVKETAKNSQTEAVKAVKTAKSETTKSASETALRSESVTTSVISQKPASVTAVQSVTSADTKLSISSKPCDKENSAGFKV